MARFAYSGLRNAQTCVGTLVVPEPPVFRTTQPVSDAVRTAPSRIAAGNLKRKRKPFRRTRKTLP